jgi:hypothetical protein
MVTRKHGQKTKLPEDKEQEYERKFEKRNEKLETI